MADYKDWKPNAYDLTENPYLDGDFDSSNNTEDREFEFRRNLLSANAKGTPSKYHLDPVPFVNKMGECYTNIIKIVSEQAAARHDSIKMNRDNMDYTNNNTINSDLGYFQVGDINGDGLLGYDDALFISQYLAATDYNKGLEIAATPINAIGEDAPPRPRDIVGINQGLVHKKYPINRIPLKIKFDNTKNYLYFSGIKKLQCYSLDEQGNFQKNPQGNYMTTDAVSYLYEPISSEKYNYKSWLRIFLDEKISKGILTISEEEPGIYICNVEKNIFLDDINDRCKTYFKEKGIVSLDLYDVIDIEKRILQAGGEDIAAVNYENFVEAYGVSSGVNLLMPRYSRRVEVEDLDENFWVIGQLLDAIVTALWKNNGIVDMLNQLIIDIDILNNSVGLDEVQNVNISLSEKTPYIHFYERVVLSNFNICLESKTSKRYVKNFISPYGLDYGNIDNRNENSFNSFEKYIDFLNNKSITDNVIYDTDLVYCRNQSKIYPLTNLVKRCAMGTGNNEYLYYDFRFCGKNSSISILLLDEKNYKPEYIKGNGVKIKKIKTGQYLSDDTGNIVIPFKSGIVVKTTPNLVGQEVVLIKFSSFITENILEKFNNAQIKNCDSEINVSKAMYSGLNNGTHRVSLGNVIYQSGETLGTTPSTNLFFKKLNIRDLFTNNRARKANYSNFYNNNQICYPPSLFFQNSNLNPNNLSEVYQYNTKAAMQPYTCEINPDLMQMPMKKEDFFKSNTVYISYFNPTKEDKEDSENGNISTGFIDNVSSLYISLNCSNQETPITNNKITSLNTDNLNNLKIAVDDTKIKINDTRQYDVSINGSSTTPISGTVDVNGSDFGVQIKKNQQEGGVESINTSLKLTESAESLTFNYNYKDQDRVWPLTVLDFNGNGLIDRKDATFASEMTSVIRDGLESLTVRYEQISSNTKNIIITAKQSNTDKLKVFELEVTSKSELYNITTATIQDWWTTGYDGVGFDLYAVIAIQRLRSTGDEGSYIDIPVYNTQYSIAPGDDYKLSVTGWGTYAIKGTADTTQLTASLQMNNKNGGEITLSAEDGAMTVQNLSGLTLEDSPYYDYVRSINLAAFTNPAPVEGGEQLYSPGKLVQSENIKGNSFSSSYSKTSNSLNTTKFKELFNISSSYSGEITLKKFKDNIKKYSNNYRFISMLFSRAKVGSWYNKRTKITGSVIYNSGTVRNQLPYQLFVADCSLDGINNNGQTIPVNILQEGNLACRNYQYVDGTDSLRLPTNKETKLGLIYTDVHNSKYSDSHCVAFSGHKVRPGDNIPTNWRLAIEQLYLFGSSTPGYDNDNGIASW